MVSHTIFYRRLSDSILAHSAKEGVPSDVAQCFGIDHISGTRDIGMFQPYYGP